MISEDEIHQILIERVDECHESVGIVVGIIDPEGPRIVSYGALAYDDARPLNGDTIFEIGSITKPFTSLLLAEMSQRGEVALIDPVSQYLPAAVKVPERGGRCITLQDLATHTSGLPRLPLNLPLKDPANPYASYTVPELYEFLCHYSLRREIGSKYEYSNVGAGLLGHVLSRRAGMDFEALVRARITGPLQMNSTAIALSDEMKTRFAVGHGARLKPVANWDLPTLAGAGALRSTANDLLRFLAAHLGYSNSQLDSSPLARSMPAMLAVRRPTGLSNCEIALGWHILTRFGNDIVWHNGGTGGFRSFAGFNPSTRTGAVVLTNSRADVDDIGCHLLDSRYRLSRRPSSSRKLRWKLNQLAFLWTAMRWRLARPVKGRDLPSSHAEPRDQPPK